MNCLSQKHFAFAEAFANSLYVFIFANVYRKDDKSTLSKEPVNAYSWISNIIPKARKIGMQLSDEFKTAFQKHNSFNAIAICYKELADLCVNVPIDISNDTESTCANDISKYDQRELKNIDNFRNELKLIVQGKMDFSFGKEIIQKLKDYETAGKPDGIQKKIEILCLIITLKVMDDYCSQLIPENSNIIIEHKHGPMNTVAADKVLLYIKQVNSIFDRAHALPDKGNSLFRTPEIPKSFSDSFENFLFVEKSNIKAGIPSIYYVGKEAISRIKNGIIKIAVIPYIGFHSFEMHDEHKNCPYNYEEALEEYKKDGTQTPVTIKYYSDEEINKQNISLITGLLEKAINEEANFVIFPEFIMSPEMRHSIVDVIKKRKSKDLIAVFTGTTYEIDEGKTSNNLYIYNSRGFQIGKYSKYSYYVDIAPRKSGHKKEIYAYEKITEKGKDCCMIDVEGIGRILPSICRDMTEKDYTEPLANLFCPNFIFIPAWSTSVQTFRIPMKYAADTIHAASILCNCCNAVADIIDKKTGKKAKPEIGLKCIPRKVKTIMNAAPEATKIRNLTCQKKCKKEGGCMILVNVDINNPVPVFKES